MNKLPKFDKGSLLVATPNVVDDLYKQSVVLICEYTTYGSFGLILNKPLTLDEQENGLDLEEVTHLKESLRIGGAMQQNQLMLLHGSEKHQDQTLKVADNIYLGGDFTFLQELIKEDATSNLLLCFGYTGWTAGELEKQFLDELWYIHPATASLVFHSSPEKLWRDTLSTMGGNYKNISMIPNDLTLN